MTKDLELKTQYIITKNTIPLCLLKKDSVKNKLIIRIVKEIPAKFFDLMVLIAFIVKSSNKSSTPKIPISAKN